MGLSIHSSGTIKDLSLVPQLTAEVQDVCTILDWRWQVTDEEKITGISFTPPECETLCLTFSNRGELVSRFKLLYDIEPATVISVKTQYAGIAIHIAVIKLLHYLSQRYFAFFELRDEGDYWQTNDEAVLQRQFERYNALLNTVQGMLRDFKREPTDTPQSLAGRLEQLFRDQWKE